MMVVLLVSCNHQQTPQQTDKKDTALNSTWSVKGCAEKATRTNTKFPESGEYNDYPEVQSGMELGIKAEGDSIVYNRFEQHLCCRQVTVSVSKKDNTIDILENWFGRGCKCRCSSTVHTVIRDLPKGEYQLYGIATGTDPIEDKPTGIKDTVLAKKVTIQ